MLSQTDKKAFAEILNGTLIIYGQVADPAVMRTWFTLLQPYSLTEIGHAFEVYLTTNKFPPKPADIIEIINRKHAGLWKSPDEVWAVARQLGDQRLSLVATDVIMEALDGLYELIRLLAEWLSRVPTSALCRRVKSVVEFRKSILVLDMILYNVLRLQMRHAGLALNNKK